MQKLEVLDFADLLIHDLPPNPQWISGGVLPKNGELLISSYAKAGKSWIILEIIRSLVLGEPLFGYGGFSVMEPAKVFLVDAELGVYNLQKRGRKSYSDVNPLDFSGRLYVAPKNPKLNFSSVEGIKYFKSIVTDYQPDVLILDPIGRMIFEDENSAEVITRLFHELAELRYLGHSWGLSVAMVHHFGKPPKNEQAREGYDALDPYNMRGSSQFFGAPDTLVTMHRTGKITTPLHEEAWEIGARFTFRAAPGLPDFKLSFNRKLDHRIRYEGMELPPPEPTLSSSGVEKEEKSRTFPKVDRGKGWRG